ncbi:MAG: response regulator [Candidatus Omnitrophota bacterium]
MNKKTAMIVEDDKETRDMLSAFLCKKNFSVIEAENGKEALAKIKAQLPDLIISDIIMPEMDGFKLLKFIKSGRQTKNIPTIMLTSKKEAESLDKGISLGADFYLPKPFSFDNLSQFIELIFGQETLDSGKSVC